MRIGALLREKQNCRDAATAKAREAHRPANPSPDRLRVVPFAACLSHSKQKLLPQLSQETRLDFWEILASWKSLCRWRAAPLEDRVRWAELLQAALQ